MSDMICFVQDNEQRVEVLPLLVSPFDTVANLTRLGEEATGGKFLVTGAYASRDGIHLVDGSGGFVLVPWTEHGEEEEEGTAGDCK